MAGKGPGLSGYSGDNADASESKMWNPQALTHDNDGNIYIADTQNNAIRLVNRSTGKITTIAGLGPNNSGFSGDNGPADLAALNSPRGIAVDADGNIYISDAGNNRIRKISNGVITTIAGTGAAGYTGDNGPATNATFASLKGLAIDSDNNLYIADAGNNVIRMIEATSGNIHTVAGDGTYGFGGDGGPATQAHLANPHNVAVDQDGNLYIADTDNSAVRKVIR
jgi:streptogramin lyase